MSSFEVELMLSEAATLPRGHARRSAMSKVVALARESEDGDLEYRALLRMISATYATGELDIRLSGFVRALALYDESPETRPIDGLDGDLLWYYKWVASDLAGTPVISLQQLDEALEDMERRYRELGEGRHGVLTTRFECAMITGRMAEAERILAQVQVTPRDRNSDCHVCTLAREVEFLALVGRNAEAISLLEKILLMNRRCSNQPTIVLSEILMPYLRTGQPAKAAGTSQRALRSLSLKENQLSAIAGHLQYFVVTAQLADGLQLLESWISLLASETLAASTHFNFLIATGALLDAVTAAGNGATPVRGAEQASLVRFFGKHEGWWSAAELAPVCWAKARSIGQQFDARNGNAQYAEWFAAAVALADEHYEV